MKYLILVLIVFTASCSDRTKAYGDKVYNGKSEVYYSNGAKPQTARTLLNYLLDVKWLKTTVHGTAQVSRPENILVVKLAILEGEIKESLSDPERIEGFDRMRSDLVDLFGEEIELHLCNRRLETKKILQ